MKHDRIILNPEDTASSYAIYYDKAERAIKCLLGYLELTINDAYLGPNDLSQADTQISQSSHGAVLETISNTNNPLYRLLGNGTVYQFLQDAEGFRNKQRSHAYHPTTSELTALAFESRAKCLEDSFDIALTLAKREANNRYGQDTFWEQARSLQWASATTELEVETLERLMKENERAARQEVDTLRRELAKIIDNQACKITKQDEEIARLKADKARSRGQRQDQGGLDELRAKLSAQNCAVKRLKLDKQVLALKVASYGTDMRAQEVTIKSLRTKMFEHEQALHALRVHTRSLNAATKRLEKKLESQQNIANKLARHVLKVDKISEYWKRLNDTNIKQSFVSPLTEIVRLIQHFPLEDDPPGSWDTISLQLLKMVDGRKPIIGKLAVAIAFMGFALEKARKDEVDNTLGAVGAESAA